MFIRAAEDGCSDEAESRLVSVLRILFIECIFQRGGRPVLQRRNQPLQHSQPAPSDTSWIVRQYLMERLLTHPLWLLGSVVKRKEIKKDNKMKESALHRYDISDTLWEKIEALLLYAPLFSHRDIYFYGVNTPVLVAVNKEVKTMIECRNE
ncbi:MAG: hypothetical protein LBP19_01350 [Treponema sp.]|jgi:hypothetical protein|nr:hypothetical protein [Treponema sp.]